MVFKMPRDKHAICECKVEIIEKLNKHFAKPWFEWKKDETVVHDLGDMTYPLHAPPYVCCSLGPPDQCQLAQFNQRLVEVCRRTLHWCQRWSQTKYLAKLQPARQLYCIRHQVLQQILCSYGAAFGSRRLLISSPFTVPWSEAHAFHPWFVQCLFSFIFAHQHV